MSILDQRSRVQQTSNTRFITQINRPNVRRIGHPTLLQFHTAIFENVADGERRPALPAADLFADQLGRIARPVAMRLRLGLPFRMMAWTGTLVGALRPVFSGDGVAAAAIVRLIHIPTARWRCWKRVAH